MPKDNKLNLKRTARISVRPCCFNNPRTSSPPYQPLSPPTDYVSAPPPTSPTSIPPLSPIISPATSNSNLLLTPKSTPPPLTSPPPAPTQPSKLTSPLAINLDPIELLFSTPPTSPQAFLDSLEELPPSITNPPPPRPSFDTIERMANNPPPIPPIESTFPSPTLDMEPPLPPFPPHLSPNLPSINPPLPPLGPNNPFPMLTHEMYCEHCQRTQALIDNFQGEMRFILNHILDRLNFPLAFCRVAYVNGLKHNLINISQLCDANFQVLFTKTQGTIFNQNDEVVFIDPRRRDVYVIDMSSFNKEINACFIAKASPSVNWLWHKKLSHLNFKNINNLAKHNLVYGLPSLTFSTDKNCSACEKGKHHRASFKTKRSFYINKSLHLLHMDLFGHVKPQTIDHNKYTLVIVDEYSRVKELRSDNETEFKNHKLEEFCDEKGIS
ncbi:retrovirus-related pol polyprotein from transposon TNT 1-94 [Tanacetum coccineum]